MHRSWRQRISPLKERVSPSISDSTATSSQALCSCHSPDIKVINREAFCGICWLSITEYPVVLGRIMDRSKICFRSEFPSWTNLPKLQHRPKFVHQPLSGDREIRLLAIHPGAPEDDVHCTLFQVDLGNVPKFDAMSYSWACEGGNSNRSCYITCGKARKTIRVTASCHNMLRRLRFNDIKRVVWIDAICIDQDNVEERNHQVRWMADIYAGADRVLVYLGEDFTHSNKVWLLETISSEYTRYLRSRNEGDCRRIQEEMSYILCAPWFSRVWVLQEVAMAKEAICIFGTHSFPWENITISSLSSFGFSSVHGYTLPGILELSLCNRYPHPDLFSLLMNTWPCQATDPRDKVYAILGLAEHNSIADLQPDYTKCVEEVYIETAKVLIRSEGLRAVLACILNNSRKSGILELPSWVPDWSCGGSVLKARPARGLTLDPQQYNFINNSDRGIHTCAVNVNACKLGVKHKDYGLVLSGLDGFATFYDKLWTTVSTSTTDDTEARKVFTHCPTDQEYYRLLWVFLNSVEYLLFVRSAANIENASFITRLGALQEDGLGAAPTRKEAEYWKNAPSRCARCIEKFRRFLLAAHKLSRGISSLFFRTDYAIGLTDFISREDAIVLMIEEPGPTYVARKFEDGFKLVGRCTLFSPFQICEACGYPGIGKRAPDGVDFEVCRFWDKVLIY